MAGHPDPDVLADYREGLLGRRRSARIRAHLDSCTSCASLDVDLAQVTELLAGAPPPRMPGHLAARLENVLAAEVAARAANPDAAGLAAASGQDDLAGDASPAAPGGPNHLRPDRGRRTWQLRPATLGKLAAAAAVLALGGYGLASLNFNAASNSSEGVAGSAASHAPSHGHGPQASPAGSAGLGAAAPEAGPQYPAGSLRVIQSGTDYLPGRLASQAQAVLGSKSANGSTARQAPAAMPTVPSQLRSCVTRITGGLRPVVADQARYQGRPATIIIYPATARRDGQVWVASPGCSALIAHSQLGAG